MSLVREQQAPAAEAPRDEASNELFAWLDGAPITATADVVRALKQVAALRTEAGADLLNRAATEETFVGLRASDGRELRAVALEELLNLGFPLALRVSPEALPHRWTWPKWGSRLSWVGVGLGAIGIGFELHDWSFIGEQSDTMRWLVYLGAGLTLASSFGPRWSRWFFMVWLVVYAGVLGLAALAALPGHDPNGALIAGLFLAAAGSQALTLFTRGDEDSPR